MHTQLAVVSEEVTVKLEALQTVTDPESAQAAMQIKHASVIHSTQPTPNAIMTPQGSQPPPTFSQLQHAIQRVMPAEQLVTAQAAMVTMPHALVCILLCLF